MKKCKHTGKIPLIDEPAGFIYHLFKLESPVSVNEMERHTQRPKMAMVAVKRIWLSPVTWTVHLRQVPMVRWRSSIASECYTHRRSPVQTRVEPFYY